MYQVVPVDQGKQVTVTSRSTVTAAASAVWVHGRKHWTARITAPEDGYDEYKLPKFRSGPHAVKVSFALNTTALVGSTSAARHWRIIL